MSSSETLSERKSRGTHFEATSPLSFSPLSLNCSLASRFCVADLQFSSSATRALVFDGRGLPWRRPPWFSTPRLYPFNPRPITKIHCAGIKPEGSTRTGVPADGFMHSNKLRWQEGTILRFIFKRVVKKKRFKNDIYVVTETNFAEKAEKPAN